jgi:3-deoxy-D-manno-octulosonate 8-phosphate phosphatase (KDO 8-P phosphatase)
MRKNTINLNKLDAIILDFDGVLTDNRVFVSEDGKEFVSCSRSDGLAFDIINKLKIKTFILSTEKNKVVTERAKKINVPVIQSVVNKKNTLEMLAFKKKLRLDKVLYIGNDLNDYYAMKVCGFTACPSDSHKKIQEISTIILKSKGGYGVMRELVEEIFSLHVVDLL